MEDVIFLSLPSVAQFREATRSIPTRHKWNSRDEQDARDSLIARYNNHAFRLRQIQEELAVIALQALRPVEYAKLNAAKLAQIASAKYKFREEAIKVFSEVCSKGL